MNIYDIIFDDELEKLDEQSYIDGVRHKMQQSVNEGLWDELDDDDEEDNEETSHTKEIIKQAVESDKKVVLSDKDAIQTVTAIYNIAVERNGYNKKFKIFSRFDFSTVKNFDAMFAYLRMPNADLSVIDTTSASSMKGTFYKAEFNNDSIKNWKVSKVEKFDNMFLNSSFNHPEVFEEWKKSYRSEILNNPKKQPSVDTSYDDIKRQEDKYGSEKYKDAFDESLTLKSYSQYIGEGVFDSIKNTASNIFSKVKGLFSKATNKLNDWFVATFDKDGKGLDSVSPASIINYFGKVKTNGPVQVLSKTDDEYTEPVNTISLNSSEVYGEKATSNEEKNLATLLAMSEARGVGGYKASKGGFNEVYQECTSEGFEKELKLRLMKPQGNGILPLLVWGAPGIGKTHIPQSIVDAYNKNISDPQKRKALIVVDCGQLSSDSLSVPMPDVKSVKDRLEANGKSTEGIDDRILGQLLKTCTDAIKEDALPVYRPTGDRVADKLLDDIANGSLNPVFASDGSVEAYEKTGEGGILMLDEFFRADVDIFARMLTLVADRKFGNNVLGSKWAIIACSNRPLDDDAVAGRWEAAPGALTNRFQQIQFVPSFNSWSEWAKKHGFDDVTLDYFTDEVNSDGEFTNWFNFDTVARLEYNTKGAQSQWPSPRSWTNCIYRLNLECELNGYSSPIEIPRDEFRGIVASYVGTEAAESYTTYYFNNMSNQDTRYSVGNILKGKLNSHIDGLDVPKRTIDVMEAIRATIMTKYDSKNPIPADIFNNVCQFLINNMPEGTSDAIVMSTMNGIVSTMGYDITDKASLKSCPYLKSMVALSKKFVVEE